MKFFHNNKRGVFVIVVFVAVCFVVYFVTKKQQATPGGYIVGETESTAPRAIPISLQNIVPGQTKKEEVVASLGNPVSQVQQGAFEIDFFTNQNSINKKHEVVTEKNIVRFVREIVTTKDKKKTDDIVSAYGKPTIELFGIGAEAGLILFAYPESGIAYLANNRDKTLFEILYFEPQPLSTFLATWGKEYSTNPEDVKEHF